MRHGGAPSLGAFQEPKRAKMHLISGRQLAEYPRHKTKHVSAVSGVSGGWHWFWPCTSTCTSCSRGCEVGERVGPGTGRPLPQRAPSKFLLPAVAAGDAAPPQELQNAPKSPKILQGSSASLSRPGKELVAKKQKAPPTSKQMHFPLNTPISTPQPGRRSRSVLRLALLLLQLELAFGWFFPALLPAYVCKHKNKSTLTRKPGFCKHPPTSRRTRDRPRPDPPSNCTKLS
jgi:hypothetical protein